MQCIKVHYFLVCIFFLLTQAFLSQNEFDKYGPFGTHVYKDLKEALQIEKGVYKMDLSYKPLDPKLYEKLSKLTDLQALKLRANNVPDYPKN